MVLKKQNNPAKIAIRVTIVGSIIDTILGVLKIVVGYFFNSHALIIDGFHSFSDLLTDIFVIIISKFAHDDPDEKHPYGHRRFETVGSVVMGSILVATAGALTYDGMTRIIEGLKIEFPGRITLYVALSSILSKELLYHYTRRVGVKIGSKLIIANAWHSRSDSFSSMVVFIGIIGSMYGHMWMDIVASIIVALLIGVMGWKFIWVGIKELIDTSLDPQTVRSINETILSIHGVKDTHNLRTRYQGPKAIIDVNVQVDEAITVSEGHEISTWVAKVLIDKFDEVSDVTVHTDVENDLIAQYVCRREDLLPLRDTVEEELKKCWKEENIFSKIGNLRLHYLDKSILVEIFLIEDCGISNLKKKLYDKASHLAWFKDVKVWRIQ